MDPSEEVKQPEQPDWPHVKQYGMWLNDWIAAGKKFKYVVMGSNGPSVNVKDPEYGVIEVNSAATALRAACHDHEFAEWWFWFAGWFPDCPPNISSHIDL